MSVTDEIIRDYERYVLSTYTRVPIVMVRGSGSWLWDAEGRKYLDFFPGWGVSGLGHCHPAVVEAIRKQAGALLHMPNNFYSEWQGKLAKAISEKSFPGKCFFCNSGAEANEGALKLARRFGNERGRSGIITMKSSFHGRTLATVTATGQEKYRKGFEPLVPGFSYVPFNDEAALRKAVTGKTAAIMLELIQGEGGINVASRDYVRTVRDMCDREGILMIVDEVQTGMGRTGHYFAHQAYGIEPDVMTLAKALGGGVAIGAFIVGNDHAGFLPPGTHASTFGGNSLACAAALAVFRVIEEEKLLDRSREMGRYLREGLERLSRDTGIVREIRGMGLMQGIELDRDGAPLVQRALEKGLIINCTAGRVLRVMPAMNVARGEIDAALRIMGETFKEC